MPQPKLPVVFPAIFVSGVFLIPEAAGFQHDSDEPVHADAERNKDPASEDSGDVESVTRSPTNGVLYTFDEPDEVAAFEATTTGEAQRRKAGPKIADGQLYLLESWWKSAASVASPAPADTATRVVEASWKLTMNTGTEGAGFAWLSVD